MAVLLVLSGALSFHIAIFELRSRNVKTPLINKENHEQKDISQPKKEVKALDDNISPMLSRRDNKVFNFFKEQARQDHE